VPRNRAGGSPKSQPALRRFWLARCGTATSASARPDHKPIPVFPNKKPAGVRELNTGFAIGAVGGTIKTMAGGLTAGALVTQALRIIGDASGATNSPA
jgi:hypothetical protein